MSNKTFETSDLSLAAFLIMNGLPLITATKNELSGRFSFILEDLYAQGNKLSLDYVNSEFCKFDNQIRTLKKIIYIK